MLVLAPLVLVLLRLVQVAMLAYGRLVGVVPHDHPSLHHAWEMRLRFGLVSALIGLDGLVTEKLWRVSALVKGWLETSRRTVWPVPIRTRVPRQAVGHVVG